MDLGLAVNESYKNKAGEVEQTCFVDVAVGAVRRRQLTSICKKVRRYLWKDAYSLISGVSASRKRSKLRVRAERVQFLSAVEMDGQRMQRQQSTLRRLHRQGMTTFRLTKR